MSRKILPKRTPLPKMAAPSSSPEPSAPPLEDFCLPLLRQKSLNRYSPYYDHDEQRARMSIDNEGSWVHITKVRELEAALRTFMQEYDDDTCIECGEDWPKCACPNGQWWRDAAALL